MKWSIDLFMQRFEEGKMGRKTVYSKLYTADFDFCKMLLRKQPNQDAGELCAIRLADDFVLWSGTNVPPSRIQVRNKVQNLKAEGDLTESGLLDRKQIKLLDGKEGTAYLFDLGEDTFLYDVNFTNGYHITLKDYMNANDNTVWPISVNDYSTTQGGAKAYKLEHKVETVDEARALLIPDKYKGIEDRIILWDNKVFITQPGFVPFDLSEEDYAILNNPPLPWNFNIRPEWMDMGGWNANVDPLCYGVKRNLAVPPKFRENVQNFQNACKNYKSAVKKWKLLNSTDVPYGSILDTSTESLINRDLSSNQMYVKGKFFVRFKRNIYGTDREIDLREWCKYEEMTYASL